MLLLIVGVCIFVFVIIPWSVISVRREVHSGRARAQWFATRDELRQLLDRAAANDSSAVDEVVETYQEWRKLFEPGNLRKYGDAADKALFAKLQRVNHIGRYQAGLPIYSLSI